MTNINPGRWYTDAEFESIIDNCFSQGTDTRFQGLKHIYYAFAEATYEKQSGGLCEFMNEYFSQFKDINFKVIDVQINPHRGSVWLLTDA